MPDPPKPAPGSGTVSVKSMDVYRRMLACLFVATSAIVVILSLIWLIDHGRPPKASVGAIWFLRGETLFAVAWTGAFGAAFSSLLRVYQFSRLPEEITGNMSLNQRDLTLYSLTPLLVGFISALVLFSIFSGKLLTGSFFPDLPALYPAGPLDAAKTMFWSFVAGFAERLVPGFLQSFANTAGAKGPDGKATPDAPPTESSRAQAREG